MLTDDKTISTPGYWEKIYNGDRNNQKVDSSNFKRPADAFDRFQWLADQVEGPNVLDIASGHAVTMKRLLAMHPDWTIICSDQTPAAKKAARWEGSYHIFSAYEIPMFAQPFNTVCISQALEYLEFPDKFMERVQWLGAEYVVMTVPEGEMKQWSQLKIWDEVTLKAWLSVYGDIVHFDKVPGLMLAKVKMRL
jgi:hypothetical protein